MQPVEHLRALVADTRATGPRAIGTGGIFDYPERYARLPGFDARHDHGAGASACTPSAANQLRFGRNLDTVSDSPHWSASLFELRVDAERAVGLGAPATSRLQRRCSPPRRPATAMPPSGSPTPTKKPTTRRCIAALPARASMPKYDAVVVAEPTRGEAVLRSHRGISSVLMRQAARFAARPASRKAATALHPGGVGAGARSTMSDCRACTLRRPAIYLR